MILTVLEKQAVKDAVDRINFPSWSCHRDESDTLNREGNFVACGVKGIGL